MFSEQAKKTIINTLMPYNPKMIGIFGSFARNENTPQSDLDILVEFKQTVNLLDLIGLESELTELLGIKVDMVTKNALHPALAPKINQDLKRLL